MFPDGVWFVPLSRLALADEGVAEAEINPLIVKAEGEGVVAVDGLIVFDDNEIGRAHV